METDQSGPFTAQASQLSHRGRSEHAPCIVRLVHLFGSVFYFLLTLYIHWQVSMETTGMARERERGRETNRERDGRKREKAPKNAVSSLTPLGACFIRLVTVSALRENTTNRSLNFPLMRFHHLSSITLIAACQPVDLLGPSL